MLNLAAFNFYLFSRLKGHYFSDDDELHTTTKIALWYIVSGGFQQAFNKCVKHCKKSESKETQY
jgi:hypothetical protein